MKKSLSILAVLVVVSAFSFSSALAYLGQATTDEGPDPVLSSHSTMIFDRDTSNNNPDYNDELN